MPLNILHRPSTALRIDQGLSKMPRPFAFTPGRGASSPNERSLLTRENEKRPCAYQRNQPPRIGRKIGLDALLLCTGLGAELGSTCPDGATD